MMDDPMNESEWEVEWGVEYNQRMITWSEKLCDGRRWIRRTVHFARPRVEVIAWRRDNISLGFLQLMTVDELLREPYITDELRSYIAQLQN